mgnify:CR=1 FL=1
MSHCPTSTTPMPWPGLCLGAEVRHRKTCQRVIVTGEGQISGVHYYEVTVLNISERDRTSTPPAPSVYWPMTAADLEPM